MDESEDTPTFENSAEEYAYHLIHGEYHIRHALNLLYESRGPKRSVMCRMLLTRAHGIVLGLFKQESQSKGKTL